MKTNKEKLNDAVGMLDEETVQRAMTRAASMKESNTLRRTTMCRRAVVLLAACLSLSVMMGVLLAIPLLTADDPTLPETNHGQLTTGESLPLEPGVQPTLSYTDSPMVRLSQLSAGNGSLINSTPMIDPMSITRNTISRVDEVNGYISTFLVLSFDCDPGETVTVTAETESLHFVGLPFNDDTDLNFLGDFMKTLMKIYDTREPGTDTVTIDPATACILVMMPHTWTALDEDTLTFTVQDESGVNVGAGSVYLGTRYLLDAEAHRLWYESCSLTRSSVLGSVRFDTPEEVTSEQVSELLKSFTAKMAEAKAALDYAPATMEERFVAARAEIAMTAFADERIQGSEKDVGNFLGYQTVLVTGTDQSENDRAFLIFADGTWGEYRVHDHCYSGCHGDGCPNGSETDYRHALMPGCRITLLDGRTFEIVEQEIDGKKMHTPVLVSQAAE